VAVPPGPRVALAPDSRTLAYAGYDGKVHLWDVLTGRQRAAFQGHFAPVTTVAFAPDGRTVASAGNDTTVLIWDVTRTARPVAPAKARQAGDLETWWQVLATKDAARAFAAMGDFAAVPQEAVAFLKERLRPAAALDGKRVEQLIGQLDDAQYRVREKAMRELLEVVDQLAPVLDKVSVTHLSPEARRRLEALRGQATSLLLQGERLRAGRAVEVLERIGTPESRQVLQALAAGAPDALITASARAALKRGGEPKP
jgi:hypothetical protein